MQTRFAASARGDGRIRVGLEIPERWFSFPVCKAQEGQASLGEGFPGLAGSQNKMAFRITSYEDEKIALLQESCPKLKLTLLKPEKYVLTGAGTNGVSVIVISAYGLLEATRLYRAEYFRLDKVGMLPALSGNSAGAARA